MFAGKHGFITPRDLFKWAERGAVGYQVRARVLTVVVNDYTVVSKAKWRHLGH